MKFQKGLLSENDEHEQASATSSIKLSERDRDSLKPMAEKQTPPQPVQVEKDRLFETVEKTKGSSKKYIGVLAIVAVIVSIGGATAWYLNRPGIGDKIRVSSAVELAVRDHFLLKEKRTATDISFYQCEGFYWARVGVETRTDIPNPLLRVPFFKARISQTGDPTAITAAPIASPAEDQPCT